MSFCIERLHHRHQGYRHCVADHMEALDITENQNHADCDIYTHVSAPAGTLLNFHSVCAFWVMSDSPYTGFHD